MTGTDQSARQPCIVHGCDEQAEVEFTWEARTCWRLGWPDSGPRTRRYCRRCFDSKKMRHPWDQADVVRLIDPSHNNAPSEARHG